MGWYEPQKIAGLQMLQLRDDKDDAMFFVATDDAVDSGPVPIGAAKVFAFYESAVEAADVAATVAAVTRDYVRIGVARILPGSRVQDANDDVDGSPGAYDVDANDDDRSFPSAAYEASLLTDAVRALGADGIRLGASYERRKLVLFEATSFTVEGSFDVEHASAVERSLGMLERRRDADRIVGIAGEYFVEPETLPAP